MVREEGGPVMAMVTKTIDFTVPHPLTEEKKRMIEKAESMPITYDEDCPECTEEMLARFKKVGEER